MLYIAHSGGKRSGEIQIVRLADLDAVKMPVQAETKPAARDGKQEQRSAAAAPCS